MYDVCIVGAGIAGTTLADILGRNGRKVALIERNWQDTDDIIGELLQPGGVAVLKKLNLEGVLANIDAQEICGYALNLHDDWLDLSYPKTENEDLSIGYGFRYHKLIENLRSICRSNKNIDCIEGSVNALVEHGECITGAVYIPQGGETRTITSSLTIVSQGSLKSIGKSLNISEPNIQGFMLGFLLQKSKLPFEAHGHVILAEPSPVISYPVGVNEIRVLIDFNKNEAKLKKEELKKYIIERILPQMPKELRSELRELVIAGKYKAKPTCQHASRPILKDGVVLLGDSLNMRHPVTGGGMTVALTDVKSLSEKLLKMDNFENKVLLNKVVSKFYIERHDENATINILALALYQVFRHETLKVACYEYLKKGEKNATEPMALLAGISRSKLILYRNFFAVAGYNLNISKLWETGLFKSFGALLDAVWILAPLALSEVPWTYSKNFYPSHNTKKLITK